MNTFGQIIREYRKQRGMPLRKLAALLDIDQSTLSKIERGDRYANYELVEKTSWVFGLDKKDLMIAFLSDKIVFEIINEPFALDILKEAKRKIDYWYEQSAMSNEGM